jgi:MOB kinase activator 1
MFRIFAIIYHQHFKVIEEEGAAAHLNTCFKHFLFFTFEFGLISQDDEELKALDTIVANLKQKYEQQS